MTSYLRMKLEKPSDKSLVIQYPKKGGIIKTYFLLLFLRAQFTNVVIRLYHVDSSILSLIMLSYFKYKLMNLYDIFEIK
jgi:hypothetical protein